MPKVTDLNTQRWQTLNSPIHDVHVRGADQERKVGSTKINYQQKMIRNDQAGLKITEWDFQKGKFLLNFF